MIFCTVTRGSAFGATRVAIDQSVSPGCTTTLVWWFAAAVGLAPAGPAATEDPALTATTRTLSSVATITTSSNRPRLVSLIGCRDARGSRSVQPPLEAPLASSRTGRMGTSRKDGNGDATRNAGDGSMGSRSKTMLAARVRAGAAVATMSSAKVDCGLMTNLRGRNAGPRWASWSNGCSIERLYEVLSHPADKMKTRSNKCLNVSLISARF